MNQFDGVSVVKKSNVYFEGRCISHTVLFADGSRKTLGVLLPAQLTFQTGAAEIMEIVAGRCRMRLQDGAWQELGAGQSFSIPANSAFDVEVFETTDYVCHFA